MSVLYILYITTISIDEVRNIYIIHYTLYSNILMLQLFKVQLILPIFYKLSNTVLSEKYTILYMLE